jgi:hypothetical protein
MLRATDNDVDLVGLEHAGFGVSHDALGAALCESWGLGAAAVASVRHHVVAHAALALPAAEGRRSISALSVLAHVLMQDPGRLDEAVRAVAPAADLDEMLVLRAARQAHEQMADAQKAGRTAVH